MRKPHPRKCRWCQQKVYELHGDPVECIRYLMAEWEAIDRRAAEQKQAIRLAVKDLTERHPKYFRDPGGQAPDAD